MFTIICTFAFWTILVISNKYLLIIECLGNDEDVNEVRGLLSKLAKNKIPEVLPAENVIDYDIDWTEKGT